jgi:hypothetical protein
VLLEPRRNPRRSILDTAEYVSTLVALALARAGSETYVSDAGAVRTGGQDAILGSNCIAALLTSDKV